MKPNIGLTDKQRSTVVDILNAVLADEFVLYVKTRNFHWNVVGTDFGELHKFFEEQYEALDEIADEVAERARSLGGEAAGSLKAFLETTRLKEHQGRRPGSAAMLKQLLLDHETVISQLRKDVATCSDLGDEGTTDYLTGLMEQHEKMAWMIRSYLEE
jgi:starvation-inducible DNA-binding protein